MKKGKFGNWVDLPPEIVSSILVRLDSIEILESAQKVCRSWRRVCKDPSMWRKIDMHNHGALDFLDYDLEIMCRHAVDRSQGGLLEIDIYYFGTNDLLDYIAARSSNLRSLRLISCDRLTDERFVEAVVKFPLLEHLEVTYCPLSGKSLKVAGKSCPNLKTLKLNRIPFADFDSDDDEFHDKVEFYYNQSVDDDAIAIAENMPELRHLELCGNRVSNMGLNAILDGCPHLEHLDLPQCFNIDFVGDLRKRCFERIKDLIPPHPTDDPEEEEEVGGGGEEEVGGVEEEEEDYSYGDDYVYGMLSGDVDNDSDTHDSCDD